MTSIYFYKMVFDFEKKDESFFIIPGCTPKYRLDKYIRDPDSFSKISHLSIVIPLCAFFLDTIDYFLSTVTRLRHLHLDFPELDKDFGTDLHRIIEDTLRKNEDTLESITLNCCSNSILEYMRGLPKLKVLVITVTEAFDVTKYRINGVGGWASLEVLNVNLQRFGMYRAQFVEIFVFSEFPMLTSFSIVDSPPNSFVQHFLEHPHNDLQRVSLKFPYDHSPHDIPHNFVFPYMPKLFELSFSSRHHQNFTTNVQPSVKRLILYHDELQDKPSIPTHEEFVNHLYTIPTFSTLEYITLRSTPDSSFNMA